MHNTDTNKSLDQKSVCFLKEMYEYKAKAFPFISNGSMSRWPIFDTPSSPKVNIILKVEQGVCDMTFPFPADVVQDCFEERNKLRDCMSVVPDGDNSLIRFHINPFSFDKPFSLCKDDVDKAFFAIQSLYSLMNLRTNPEKLHEDPIIVNSRKGYTLWCEGISCSSICFGIRRDGKFLSSYIMSGSEQAMFKGILETICARLSGFPLPECTSYEECIDKEDYEEFAIQVNRIRNSTLDDLLAIEGIHVDKTCLFNDMNGIKVLTERG